MRPSTLSTFTNPHPHPLCSHVIPRASPSSPQGTPELPRQSRNSQGRSKGAPGAVPRPAELSVSAATALNDLLTDQGSSRTGVTLEWSSAAQSDNSPASTTTKTACSTSTTTKDEVSASQTSTSSASLSSMDGAVTMTQQGAAAVAVDAEAGVGWRRRWTMVLLCFTAFMLCNMDRVNMAVAILPMSQQYSWQPATMGMVQASFFWGYLCTQILGGIWAAKFGGKLVLGLGVAWWSFATALTPFAASAGLPALMAARALMGLGEGVAMPAMNQLLSKWVPAVERSRSLALVYSGMFLGSMTGLTLSPQIINNYGWPAVFVSFGSLGLVWLAAWVSLAAANPATDPRTTPKEKAFIAANTMGKGTVDIHGGGHKAEAVVAPTQAEAEAAEKEVIEIPWKALLSRKEVWAIILCHFCHNWGTFILLTWMPSYYSQVLGLDLASSATLSCLPWATMAVCANAGGWLADTAVARGATVTTVRKVMQTIGFLGPAVFLGQLSNVNTALGAVICMMGAQGCDAFSQSGLYSNHQDIAPRYAGVLLGMSNTAGVLAGVAGSLVTGFILQHGTWDQVWQVAIALYLVGTVIWNLWATGERIFD